MGSKKPKSRVKYRKLTLSVQLLRGHNVAQRPINRGFVAATHPLHGGGRPLVGVEWMDRMGYSNLIMPTTRATAWMSEMDNSNGS